MDLRSKTIQDLLDENQRETQKWEQYREEQKSVQSNLVEFQKKIEIDVLVPIGTKAFVPGVLYHTNEILVSHFQGYFSKVTTNTALEMLDHRVKLANNHLQKLEEEYKLFEPKLELPMIMDGGKEIIEEYKEEDEKKWRAKHRESVRRMKLMEKQEISSTQIKPGHEIMNLLEELELIEELEDEINSTQPELDETNAKLNRLISGELKLPPQIGRTSHYQTTAEKSEASQILKGDVDLNASPSPLFLTLEQCSEKILDDKDDSQKNISLTTVGISNDLINEAEDDDYDNIPLEIRILVESSNNLKLTDKIKIFKKKLKSVRKFLRTMKIETEDDLENKLVQLEIKDTLEEIIEDMEDNEEADEADEEIEENETEDEDIQLNLSDEHSAVLKSSSKPKRKYTFNENVDICYINSKDPPRKISDDRNPKSENTEIDRPALKKVDIPLVKPKIDYDSASTFFIRFNHAVDAPVSELAGDIVENFTKDVIMSPFEIYKLMKQKIDNFNRKGRKSLKQAKFVQVSLPIESEKSLKPLKSILKPGLVMNHENFSEIEEEQIEGSQQIEENYEESCDFSKIMGEVTEHPITTNDQNSKSSEDLPQENVKISKFKQSRKKS